MGCILVDKLLLLLLLNLLIHVQYFTLLHCIFLLFLSRHICFYQQATIKANKVYKPGPFSDSVTVGLKEGQHQELSLKTNLQGKWDTFWLYLQEQTHGRLWTGFEYFLLISKHFHIQWLSQAFLSRDRKITVAKSRGQVRYPLWGMMCFSCFWLSEGLKDFFRH